MKARFLGLAAFAGAVLLSPICNVEACGPDFQPDVFVRMSSPDDPAEFAKGRLGILQAGFDSTDYAVAFRYLNGGELSDAERQVYAPSPVPPKYGPDWWKGLTPEQIRDAQAEQEQERLNAQAPTQWLNERAKYVPTGEPIVQKPNIPTDWQGNVVIDENYLNCPGAAFQNAALTLTKRADAWGKQSPSLVDWIRAQDAVFSNCAGKTGNLPSSAASDSPVLLKADRAYQIASAAFYARQFDDAARQFEAIAHDKTSPWQRWGTYLAARATVRKAFAMGKPTNPYSTDLASFDMDTMKAAQQMLETLLKEPNPAPSRKVVQDELNFIRIRTEPEKRVMDICIALAGPAPDPNFSQNLQDLSWVLVKHLDVGNPPPLLSWIEGWRGAGTAATAFEAWQRTNALPWFVMALAKAGPSDPFVPTLLAAAAKIEKGTTAYDVVFFHRVRLLIALDRKDEARTLLDEAIPALRNQKPSSNLNALLGERMALARNFSEFLTYAPRTLLSSGSQGAADLCAALAHQPYSSVECAELKQPSEFDNDSVNILNQQIPLRLLIEAARSTDLPRNLREQIAIIAWTRAVLLQDAQSAASLASLLPKPLRDSAGSSIDFPASLTILRNPGIRPYLEPGVPRVASFSYFDQFRNNWWCKPWQSREDDQAHRAAELPIPWFLPVADAALGRSQYSELEKLPDSVAIIGQRVIDYAMKNPDGARIAEALALTVRASHYACQTYNSQETSESGYTQVSKTAFQLLHRRYPNSDWARKTPYYY